ncbi:MAG TPA: outer membrane lipid asymmetry maintenance protein MlaD [Stellaceae bacterium]|jgi:phospholipid/cholesterol/gamma-HCH transport system substrate-binding protein|nr:outer membrane lipid asymmetry maintenance protein MlaD [Stellaceae bacterium]
MNRNAVETVMGAVVLVVAAVFLFFAYTTTQVHAVGGYTLTAQFDKVDGLRDGGDVKISGIKVGSIISQTLDPKTFFATLTISMDPAIKLPVDSVATISSSGLLGDKFLSIEPGNDDQTIPPGGRIIHTSSGMSLESLIGQVIYGQAQQKKGGDDNSQPAPAPMPTPAPAKP